MPLYVLEAATVHIDDVEIAARDVSIGWPDLDLWLGPRLQFRLDGIESPGRIARLFAGEKLQFHPGPAGRVSAAPASSFRATGNKRTRRRQAARDRAAT